MNSNRIFLNALFGIIIATLLYLNNMGIKQNNAWFEEQKELALAAYYLESDEKETAYQIYEKYINEKRYSLSAEFNLVYADKYIDEDKELARSYLLMALNSHPYLIDYDEFRAKYSDVLDLYFLNGEKDEE